VYLPLLWEPSFCSRSPIALGYTRGHFCALIPPEPVSLPQIRNNSGISGAASGITGASYLEAVEDAEDEAKATFLPLVTADRKQLLPIHFLSQTEVGNEEVILRQWLDVCATESGLVVAQQRIAKPPLLVAQMTEEWLNHYRKLAQSNVAPFSTRGTSGATGSSTTPTLLRSSPTISSTGSGSNLTGSRSNVTGSTGGSHNNNNNGGYSSDGDTDEE
jgi:ubiquitin thioesterase ZRANB1